MDLFDLVNRTNADYVDRLYQQFLKDPRTVEEPWRSYFAGFEAGNTRPGTGPASAVADSAGGQPGHAGTNLPLENLIYRFRELGHFVATLDPLGNDRPSHPLLDLGHIGIGAQDLDRPTSDVGFKGAFDGTVRGLIQALRDTYCRSIGVEYQGISDKTQREWLASRMEAVYNRPKFTPDRRKSLMYQLIASQGFEEYLALKYPTAKRFSLEGAEALVPILNTIVDEGCGMGIDEYVLGMAHRGRLNVLAHVLNKPYEYILAEFEGTVVHGDDEGDGDVKYHMGYSNERTVNGRSVHLSLSYNPSHLELVNPVVEGIVRAKQYARRDDDRVKVVPILIHGDAAFTGQGIVQETLGLSEMPFWRTGGTIHVVVNNQIGFTTMPKQGRFTPYPTDIARAIQAPVFHVNGDDPEACAWAAKLAVEFRQQFHVDVIIDLWCYRRYGHNEVDEPSFTQPLMCRQIDAHPRPREVYAAVLSEAGIINDNEMAEMKAVARDRCDRSLVAAKEVRPRKASGGLLLGPWKGLTKAGSDWTANTAVPADVLRVIGQGCAKLPADFTVHPKMVKTVQARLDMAMGKAPIDWAGAEQLALGSLLLEGTPVRFTGQDAQRGTFSHRHACLHDYESGVKFYPLANISDRQAPFIIVNTLLSELAVLGFEYGFSSADPRNLVIWEAQFGDFVNGAMAIIDQFIVAAESKWAKMSGLVMLLPHGYEGQGPEHSNAYIERFLALCAENNIQVAIPSMPGQYFHLLRRQMKRNFRKPLVLFMPKSLLRSPVPGSASTLKELTDAQFQCVIDDPQVTDRDSVVRLLLCTGKVYFTLQQAKEKTGTKGIAIARIEQLYPFPKKELQQVLAKYRGLQEVGWVQEEPKNRGAWTFMEPRLRELLHDSLTLSYHGRDEAASPATGSAKMHRVEEEELISHSMDLNGITSVAVKTDTSEAVRTVAAQEPATAKSTGAVSD